MLKSLPSFCMLLLLCVVLSGCGSEEATYYDLIFEQDRILSKDDNEPFSGIYAEYYDYDGKNPKHRIRVKDGIFQGEYSYYYPDGKLQAEGTNKDGRFYGYHTTYWENGNIKQKTYFNRDVDGYDYDYFKSGKIKELKHFNESGQLDGKTFTFYESGPVREEKNYANGKKEGLFTTKTDDGALISLFIYRNNILQEHSRQQSKPIEMSNQTY